MEHKSRKMFAAIAVIMLCAVAIIGVGYAYTAQTKNADNNVNTEYVTLYQDDAGETHGAYTFVESQKVEWNTSDYMVSAQPMTDFWIDGTSVESIVLGEAAAVDYDVVQLGDSFIVGAQQTGGTLSQLTCTVTATNFKYQSNVGLFVKVVCNDGAGDKTTYMNIASGNVLANNTFKIGVNTDAYYTATVSVLYGYPSDPGFVNVEHAVGTPAVGPEGNPIANGSLSFSVKTGTSTPATGITLTPSVVDKHTITTAEDDFTLTAAVTPAGANQTVIWETSNSAVLTFTVDALTGLTATLNGVSAGEATITATSLDGHFIASYAITVTAA